MCLTTKTKYPRISFWDIKVKKVILIEGGNDNYKSPLQRFQIRKGQRILRPEERTTVIQAFFGKYRKSIYTQRNGNRELWKYSYGRGFIHSYHKDNERISKLYKEDSDSSGSKKYIVMDAIIPAGTPYYYDPQFKEYCSTKLILKWKD